MQTVDLEVVIPAYNEQDRIGRTLARIKEYYDGQTYSWRCTVVSDGSTDKTNEIVTTFCEGNPEFRLDSYTQNRGKGYAVRLGMLRANANRVLFCDADLATPQEETEKLWRAMDEGYDVAIGSRPLKESNLEIHQPPLREFLGRMFNKAVQTLATKGIDDTQCGFKLFTKEAAQEVFGRCKLDGFSFDFEALMIARDLEYKIAEVPIRWSHQEGSKVSILRDGPRMLRDLVKLRIAGKKARMKQNEESKESDTHRDNEH
jgi:dolichyl-phosphate beta-glucosyltransferase